VSDTTPHSAHPPTESNESKPEKPGFFSFENFRSLGVLVIVIFAFRWSVISPYHVPTASMEPSIKVGDRLLALKLAYDLKIPFTEFKLLTWGQPERGDIIVFRYPKDPSIDYVKRVIGVAGDRIRMEDHILYINGSKQERSDHNFDRTILEDIDDRPNTKNLFRENLTGTEHWVIQNKSTFHSFISEDWPVDGTEYVVPQDSVFVIGDNRDNSTDSRAWGKVPLSYVRGEALMVLWSMYGHEDSSLPSIRWNRFGHILR